MSASTEKKLRAQARAEGNDKKAIAAAEEAQKKHKTKVITIITIAAVILFVAVVLFFNSSFMYRSTTAVTVNNEVNYSPAEVNYEYASQYYNTVNSYGSYSSIIGLDTTYGLAGLTKQDCTMLEDGGTWRDFFIKGAEENLKQYYALAKYAEENGLTLTDEEKQEIESEVDTIDETATSYGYPTTQKFLESNYGKGVNKDILRNAATAMAIASKAYTHYTDNLTITDEEVKEAYPTVQVRHILIKAVADENGEYSDEALTAAKTKAEEILTEWENGDKTEDSFAKLAEKYSEDEGSNTNGGLYDSLMKGTTVTEFNDFCFADGRKAGDTGIVFGDNGSYQGYHVMYYVGEGDPAKNETGISYLKSDKGSAWIEEITGSVEITENFWLRLVGKS